MPRVAGIYSRPTGIDAVANNTIDSGKYNSNVADVEADLNLPRPIVAGGTGASNAHDALVNLGAEFAHQVVTNYDTFPFESGSFASLPGATSSPDGASPATNSYMGIAVKYDASNITLEARKVTGPTPGQKYTRQSSAGVWSAWVPQAGNAADFVKLAGDTMTGNLVIAGSVNPSLTLNRTASGAGAAVAGYVAGNPRWRIELGDGTTESGGNTGSLFSVSRFSDAGAFIDSPFVINRATAQATMIGALTVNGISSGNDVTVFRTATPTTGVIQFGNSGSRFLNFDGTVFQFNGALLAVGGPPTNPNIAANKAYVDSTVAAYLPLAGGTVTGATTISNNFGVGTAAGGLPGLGNTTTGHAVRSDGLMLTSTPVASCAVFNINADGASVLWNRSGTQVGSISVNSTTTAYNTSSDGTLKEDLQPAGITASQILNDTEIFNFKWKATGERSYGVIAQQAAPIYPGPFFHDDNVGTDGRWFVDYSKYVPILIQEAKTLRTRIADLETRLDVLDKFREKIEAL